VSKRGRKDLETFIHNHLNGKTFAETFPLLLRNSNQSATHDGATDDEIADGNNTLPISTTFNYDSDHASSIDNRVTSILELFLDDSPQVSNRRLQRLILNSLIQRQDYCTDARRLYHKLAANLLTFFKNCRDQPAFDPHFSFSVEGEKHLDWGQNLARISHPVTNNDDAALIVATDGSYKDNKAGSAVISEDPENLLSYTTCRFRFTGHQSSGRAEAFAILAALRVADPDRNLLIWTDSLNSIKAIETVQSLIANNPLSACYRRNIENKSIYLAIADHISKRKNTGRTTEISWVHSHADGEHIEPEQILNDQADKHAKIARIGDANTPTVHECFRFLPSHYLTVKKDMSIIETGPHPYITTACKSHHLITNKANACKTSERLRDAYAILDKVPPDTTFFPRLLLEQPYTALSAFNILYDNIRTPHNSYNTHKKSFPKIYPTDTCPLCHMRRADAYHIFCECPKIHQTRHRQGWATALQIQQLLGLNSYQKSNVYDWLITEVIPAHRSESRSGFNRGILVETQLTKLSNISNGKYDASKHGTFSIQSITYNTFFTPILKEYNLSLLKTKNSFSQRLKAIYNITIAEKHAKANLARQTTTRKRKKTS